jgi:hypothetical protein
VQIELGSTRTRANVYASPDGGGFGLHYDRDHVFILQLRGRKRWRFSDAADPIAALGRIDPDRALDATHVPPEASLREATLEPGDVLYLPPGAWHRGYAVGHSLAVTVGVIPIDMRDLLDRLVTRAFDDRPAWLTHLPIDPLTRPTLGAMPRAFESFLTARLDELRALVDRLRPEDLYEAWLEQMHDLPAAPLLVPSGGVEPDEWLEVAEERRPRFARCHGAPPESRLMLFIGEHKIPLHETLEPVLQAMAARERFRADEVQSWFWGARARDWSDVRDLLAALVDIGALRRVEREPLHASSSARPTASRLGAFGSSG